MKILWRIIVGIAILFVTPVEAQHVTFEQFGAKGNGQDETKAIMNALMHAKTNHLPVKLSGGNYVFSPKTKTDITGIPSITGEGTIDCSNTGANAGYRSMTHLLLVKGEKRLLDSNINVQQGGNTLLLKPGLDCKSGDVLFITSAEPLPNPRRSYNCKGQRAIVSDYDNKTGKLIINGAFYFDIRNGFVWKNTVIPRIEIGGQVKFKTSPMNFLGCLEIIYAEGAVSGSYENFALAAISLRSSKGHFKNVRTDLPITLNNGYSYGISIADMSDGYVENCILNGGRHTVSGTGGGLWNKSESGGKDEPAGYSATLEINGGNYTGTKNVNGISPDIGTIDAHGNVYAITVRNCAVYGGINLGANYATIDSVTIYTDTKRAFNFGSDVEPGSEWGHYNITNSTIICDEQSATSMFITKSDVESIVLRNVALDGISENTLLADFRYPAPKKLKIEHLSFAHHDDIGKPPRFLASRKTSISIDEISCIKAEDIKLF